MRQSWIFGARTVAAGNAVAVLRGVASFDGSGDFEAAAGLAVAAVEGGDVAVAELVAAAVLG